MIELIVEIIMGVLGMVSTWLFFLYRRLLHKQDKQDEAFTMLRESHRKQIESIQSDLNSHRIEDAANFPTREEVNIQLINLKGDLREIMRPVVNSVQAIETHIRTYNK